MDETIEKLNRTVVFDAKPTSRTTDENGYMKVINCNITKEQVVPYLGMELPCCDELGLIPDKKYYMYRPAKELQNAVKSFDGVPLEYEHHETDAENLPKEKIIGAVGTDGIFESPYIKNTLIFHDAAAIKAIEDGEVTELSASYFFTPVMEGGIFGGEHYDGVMTNIRGNHVALVRRGRAGPDVRVADSALKTPEMLNINNARPAAGDNNTADENTKEGVNLMDNEEKVKDVEGQQKLFGEEKPVQKDANPTPPAPAEGQEGDPGKQTADAELQALKDAMTACGIDAENEEFRKAFAAGTKWGEEKEKADPKKLDAEHEAEGEKKAEGDECGKDAQNAEHETERDAKLSEEEAEKIKDAAVKEAVTAAQDSFKKLMTAAKDCESILGSIATENLLAMDADTVYAKALEAKGIKIDGIDKSAFPAMVGFVKANDAKTFAAAKANDSAKEENSRIAEILKRAKEVRCEAE